VTDSSTDAEARELSRAIASGSPEAFAQLYRMHHAPLIGLIRSATRRDDAFAHDVLHDAMMKVTRSMPALPCAAALDAWLKRTVLNTALDRIRAEQRRERRERVRARMAPGHHSDTDDTEDSALARVQELLSGIDDESRHLLTLRYGMGWTLQRIANVLGLSTGAVDGRIRRLSAALRAPNGTEEEHSDA